MAPIPLLDRTTQQVQFRTQRLSAIGGPKRLKGTQVQACEKLRNKMQLG